MVLKTSLSLTHSHTHTLVGVWRQAHYFPLLFSPRCCPTSMWVIFLYVCLLLWKHTQSHCILNLHPICPFGKLRSSIFLGWLIESNVTNTFSTSIQQPRWITYWVSFTCVDAGHLFNQFTPPPPFLFSGTRANRGSRPSVHPASKR